MWNVKQRGSTTSSVISLIWVSICSCAQSLHISSPLIYRPLFPYPGIKYLDDMVRLMRATRRGNQAFESALEAAHEVIAGVDKAQAMEAEKKARLAKQAEIPFAEDNVRRSSQNLDVSPGSPSSRAGSYRRRRRSHRRSRNSRNQADATSQSPKSSRDRHVRERSFRFCLDSLDLIDSTSFAFIETGLKTMVDISLDQGL